MLPLKLSKEGISRTCMGSVVTALKVRGQVCGLPGRLSKKRRREMTVTETLIGHPRVVFTSRPAKGLSSGADSRMVTLLGVATGGCKRAVMVVARSSRVTRITSHVLIVRSKRIISFE